MSEPWPHIELVYHFTCPQCGSHYFGRDTAAGPDGKAVVLSTVRCHGDVYIDGRLLRQCCDWRGEWPPKLGSKDGRGV